MFFLLIAVIRNQLSFNFLESNRGFFFGAILALYFWTFFHKINSGYLDPDLSCSISLTAQHVHLLSFGTATPLFKTEFIRSFWPLFTLIVEGLFFFLLLFKSTRVMGLILVFIFHSLFSIFGFYNFAAAVYPLLLLFLNFKVNTDKGKEILLKTLNIYLASGIFCQPLLWVNYHYILRRDPLLHTYVIGGIYLATTLYCFYAVRSANRNNDISISLFNVHKKRVVNLVSFLVIFLIGLSPYIGLGTMARFSMFSNLKTPTPYSNHLILGGLDLKIADYEEDYVTIEDLNPLRYEIHRVRIRRHYALPKIELDRWIDVLGDHPEVQQKFTLKRKNNEIFQLYPPYKDYKATTSWLERKFLLFRPYKENAESPYCSW